MLTRPLLAAAVALLALGHAGVAGASPPAAPGSADDTTRTATASDQVEPHAKAGDSDPEAPGAGAIEGAADLPGPLYCDAAGACELPFTLPETARFVVAPLHGEVSLGMAAFIQRAVAGLDDGDVLILDINTFGGRVDAAVQIRDALLSAGDRGARTIAFVHPRAISAGALISLATDLIVVAPGATIGAATPVTQGAGGEMQAAEEKVVSYMRTEMRSTAEARGRSGDIAEAMVDRDLEVPGLSAKGKLLTLDGSQALAHGVASFEASDTAELIADLGYVAEGSHTVEELEWSWAEEFAGWLSGSALSGLLMSIGMLAIMIGLYTGGSPLPLGIGVLCLAAFFFGHHIVNLAGLEELLLFGCGVILVAVEVIAPGHIVPGVLGVICILGSLFLGLIDFEHVPLDVQWEMGWVTRALATLFGAVLATGVLAVFAVRLLPTSPLGRWIVLETNLPSGASDAMAPSHDSLVGRAGVAATDLRPAGRVTIEGKRYDAVAEIGFIDRDAPIVVRKRRGFSLVVAPAPRQESPPS